MCILSSWKNTAFNAAINSIRNDAIKKAKYALYGRECEYDAIQEILALDRTFLMPTGV